MTTVQTQMPLTANGNVRAGRFLTLVDGAANFGLAVEATASTQLIVGVSARGGRYAPNSAGDDGYIAVAGEGLPYHGPGQIAELLLGGTVSNANIPLSSDGSGRGVASAPSDGTTTYYGAIALRGGSSGEYVPVWVMPMVVTA